MFTEPSYFKDFFKENKATKAKEINNQPIDTEQAVEIRKEYILTDVCSLVDNLYVLQERVFHNKKELREHVNSTVLPTFTRLEEKIKKIKESSSSENFAALKLYRPIIENNNLRKKLDDLAKNFGNPGYVRSQSEQIMTDFKLENLREKMRLLKELKEKSSFAALRKDYDDEWLLRDLIHDEDFKQTYINQVIDEKDELISNSLKKDINKYIELAKQGEDIASKYFGGKVSFQAYCEETDNASRVLNVNLINHNGNEPIRISDILQQEKNVGELKIYCNKKYDMCARREDKKRYYEFEEGACYGAPRSA